MVKIRDTLELEPIKWRTFVHMPLITGTRRGKVSGLQWDHVDFDHILADIFLKRHEFWSELN